MATKRDHGQFYTTRAAYILEGLPGPPEGVRCVLEPFAGQGDLLDWIHQRTPTLPVEAYDIDPKREDIRQRDTLRDPPDYTDTWVLTNPPYLARNKSTEKSLYDLYGTNDLYKCFLQSLCRTPCTGGIVIVPLGFLVGARDLDCRCRNEFLTQYRLLGVNYFEESVFADTSTTVVAIAFTRAETPLTEQEVRWTRYPSRETRIFPMRASEAWVIGGDLAQCPVPSTPTIRRHVEGQPLREGEQQTWMTLHALDSGTPDGRIKLVYTKGYVYPAKESSRTYATLRIVGRTMTEDDQEDLCRRFTTVLEQKRLDTWSLFLPQYRESKDYARKRIPFELAYRILVWLLTTEPGAT